MPRTVESKCRPCGSVMGQRLDFGCCSISEIADTLSGAPALQFVDLSNNRLAGRLDQSCGLAKSGTFQQLSLKNNFLTGYLPQCLVGVKNLWEFHVDNNALVGPLPSIPNAKSSRLVHLTGANQVSLTAAPSISMVAVFTME